MKLSRLVAFFAVMVVFTAVFQAGSMSEVSKAESDLFMSEFEKLVEGIDGFGIFVHNTTIALPMFVPGFGVAWGLFSSWSTGYAFAAISASMPELVGIEPLTILFLSPFGVMEVTAYSLAMSRSLLMIMALVQKAGISDQGRPLLVEIGVVIALLLAGGYIEFYMIEQAQEMMDDNALLAAT